MYTPKWPLFESWSSWCLTLYLLSLPFFDQNLLLWLTKSKYYREGQLNSESCQTSWHGFYTFTESNVYNTFIREIEREKNMGSLNQTKHNDMRGHSATSQIFWCLVNLKWCNFEFFTIFCKKMILKVYSLIYFLNKIRKIQKLHTPAKILKCYSFYIECNDFKTVERNICEIVTLHTH